MKTIFSILCLVLSTLALADIRHGAECDPYGKGRDMKVSNLTKISQDDESVTFRMSVVHGFCRSLDEVQGAIKLQKGMVKLGHYGFSFPGKKVFGKVSNYRLLSETELEIELTFVRTPAKLREPRKFLLDIWVADWVGFPWEVKLIDQGGEPELKLRGFERL